MKNTRNLKTVLLGTALTLPVAYAFPVMAQEQAPTCGELIVLYEAENLDVDISEQEIRSIIEANVEEECARILAEAEARAGAEAEAEAEVQAEQVDELSEEEQAVAREEETVVVEQEVTVEGEVFVEQQPPRVSLEQPASEVEVTAPQPEVTVTEERAEIVIKQASPTIRVDMPQPSISIDQPAPEIIITMPEPGVDVATTRPEVVVVQAEPVITVTQAPPQFDLELQPATGAEGEGIRVTDRATGEEIPQVAMGAAEAEPRTVEDAEIEVQQTEAVVSYTEVETAPLINIERQQPEVRFEAAEPTVEFTQVGEPNVTFTQAGEATVTFRESAEGERTEAEVEQQQAQAEQEEQATAEAEAEEQQQAEAEPEAELEVEVEEVAEVPEELEQEAQAEGEQVEAEAEEMAAEAEQATEEEQVAMGQADVETAALMVGDITGEDVFNEAGEDIGELERVVQLNGEVWAVISGGGFLGIGDKEVPIEFSRVHISPEGQLVVPGLTEEQIEAANDVDLTGAQELPADTPLQTAN